MNTKALPVVALTLGDPAGIGPELIARLLADPETCAQANVVVVGDPWLWEDGQKIAGNTIATTPVAGFADVRGRADPSRPAFLAMDTVRFNRLVDSTDRNAYPFTPFHGTPLRTLCEELGYIRDEQIVQSVIVNGSLLDMPQFPQNKVNGLVKTFNLYVKFPESRWSDIKRAEEDTPEGNRIYNELKLEFVDRYFKKQESFEESAMGQPMNA